MPAHLIDARRVNLLFCSSSNLLTLLNVVQSGRFQTDSDPAARRRISFSHFRVDTSGNVFANFRLNGQEIGGPEIELLNTPPGTSPTTDKNKFTISAKELISTNFADAINKLFNATVLTPGQELATLSLVARVAN